MATLILAYGGAESLYALFILQDVDTALKYYELAALDWYYFEGEVEWNISSAKKEAILRRGQEFRRMSQLVRNPGESVSLWRRMVVWDGEEAYKESFIEYIHNLNAKDHSGIYQCATAFFS